MPIQYDFNHMPAHLKWIWQNNFHLFSTGFVLCLMNALFSQNVPTAALKTFMGKNAIFLVKKKMIFYF